MEELVMKYVCDVCGWEYDEEKGYPEGGIAPGTKWEDVPADFECPLGTALEFHREVYPGRSSLLWREFCFPGTGYILSEKIQCTGQ